MDPFYGEIRALPYTYAPLYWALCDGSQVSISQNPALYSLLGITFGGNGTTYFNIPNLLDLCVIGEGTQSGTTYNRANTGGSATVALSEAQIPNHNHTVKGLAVKADQTAPGDTVVFGAGTPGGRGSVAVNLYNTEVTPGQQMAPNTLTYAGMGQAHYNVQPYVKTLYCIALEGLYPPRP